MEKAKKAGIWMDHTSAHVMELTNDSINTTIVQSGFDHSDKVEALERSESVMHNKEQHSHAAFYKSLKEIIINYDDVLLFGPTTAKNELANLIKGDHDFENIHVIVEHSDKMTENQEKAFVKKYFLKN